MNGRSLPLSIITENLNNVLAITASIANYDNNQHAENENIRIQNLRDGIEIYAALVTVTVKAETLSVRERVSMNITETRSLTVAFLP